MKTLTLVAACTFILVLSGCTKAPLVPPVDATTAQPVLIDGDVLGLEDGANPPDRKLRQESRPAVMKVQK